MGFGGELVGIWWGKEVGVRKGGFCGERDFLRVGG